MRKRGTWSLGSDRLPPRRGCNGRYAGEKLDKNNDYEGYEFEDRTVRRNSTDSYKDNA